MRRLLPALLLLAACDPAGLPGPQGAVEAERKAYELALASNDTSAISLEIATLALHVAIDAEADKRAAACEGSGRELQACQHKAAKAAEDHGQPVADGIDAASAAQLQLRALLLDYQNCTPNMADRWCQANAVAKALKKSPEVMKAIEEARKNLRNVRPSH